MSKTFNWLREEFRRILPVWAFFFVAFGLVALTRMATYGEYHITPEEQPEFLVGSLIMAKVVLLIDSFFKIRREPGRPLIYGTLWNTGLYFAAAIALHHVEQLIRLMRHNHVAFVEANREVFRAMEKPTFVTIMIGVLALTFLFCMLRELIDAIGRERFMELFFGRHPRKPTEANDIRRTA